MSVEHAHHKNAAAWVVTLPVADAPARWAHDRRSAPPPRPLALSGAEISPAG